MINRTMDDLLHRCRTHCGRAAQDVSQSANGQLRPRLTHSGGSPYARAWTGSGARADHRHHPEPPRSSHRGGALQSQASPPAHPGVGRGRSGGGSGRTGCAIQAGGSRGADLFPGLAREPTTEKLATGLGANLDGVLCDYRVFDEAGLLLIPDYLSDAVAAALPCAGVTAWNAVVKLGGIRPGDTVLVQGTGGVALFALQFAKLMGATVILTSSSDEKLDRARQLGAVHLFNYRAEPNWSRSVKDLTDGRGADLVIDIGGAGTLEQSLRAVRVGGTIALIGVVAGSAATSPAPP